MLSVRATDSHALGRSEPPATGRPAAPDKSESAISNRGHGPIAASAESKRTLVRGASGRPLLFACARERGCNCVSDGRPIGPPGVVSTAIQRSECHADCNTGDRCRVRRARSDRVGGGGHARSPKQCPARSCLCLPAGNRVGGASRVTRALSRTAKRGSPVDGPVPRLSRADTAGRSFGDFSRPWSAYSSPTSDGLISRLLVYRWCAVTGARYRGRSLAGGRGRLVRRKRNNN